MSREMPDGIRFHNPGNLRITDDRWQGLDIATTEMRRREATRQTPPHAGFFAFTSAPFGIRALCVTLKNYQDKRTAADGSPVDTLQELVNRYAPASDNNPVDSYVAFLCSETGFRRGEALDFYDYATMRALVPAIIRFEQGVQPYADTVIDKGLFLAGIEPEHKPLRKSRTLKGASLAAAGALASPLGAVVDNIAPTAQALTPLLGMLKGYSPWVTAAVVLVGAFIITRARVDDRKKGLR